MVGTGRFELPTPRTPSECSTRLSHVPTRKEPAARIRSGWGFTREFYHQRRSCVRPEKIPKSLTQGAQGHTEDT